MARPSSTLSVQQLRPLYPQVPLPCHRGPGHRLPSLHWRPLGQAHRHGPSPERDLHRSGGVLTLIEKCLLLFRAYGQPKERFADTITRLGFDQVQAMLLSDELLQRKEEILSQPAS